MRNPFNLPTGYSYWRLWLQGWASVIDGLVTILTLGRVNTYWPIMASSAVLRSARVKRERRA